MSPELRLVVALMGEVEKFFEQCGAPLTEEQRHHLDHARVAAMAGYSA